MGEYMKEKNLIKKKIEVSKEVLDAIFIGGTHSSKNLNLNRWECPNCRKNKNSECRFNLDHKKVNINWKCRFCKSILFLREDEKI